MRFAASFLVILVSFLSVESGIPLVMNTMAQCCAGSCHDGQKSSSTDSPNMTFPGQCNPFLGCGSCAGITIECSLVSRKVLDSQTKLFTIDSKQFSLLIPSDFWHPPKLT